MPGNIYIESHYYLRQVNKLPVSLDFVRYKLNVPKNFLPINTIHNLDELGCIKSLQEIERVKKKHSYLVVDGWSTPEEERDLKSWVLTAVTVLHTSEWEKLFEKAGYTGDYSFWKVS